MTDSVNHPAHYNVGNIEVIDAIEDWGLNFCLGNAVKYIARADHKGEPVEDLQKAVFYLNHEIVRRKTDNPDATLFRFQGYECLLSRSGDDFFPNECCCVICDVCRFSYAEPEQYPCCVCCHGNGDREYFKLNLDKVEVIK